jgi:hypothetical protein
VRAWNKPLKKYLVFFYAIFSFCASEPKIQENMKKLLIIGCMLAGHGTFAQEALGEIVGTIAEKNGTTIVGAQVFVIDQDKKYQALTDVDGRFRITGIPAGKYNMNVKVLRDTMKGILADVPMDGFFQAGLIHFDPKTVDLKGVTVKANNGEMKLVYGSLPIREVTSEEIEQSPVKFSVSALATAYNSDVRMAEDGELMFRGARKGDMIYLLDGVKGRQVNNVPSCAIGRMMVYTGGIPAKYGDTLGGVIVVETKSYFDLYREWEREQMRKE